MINKLKSWFLPKEIDFFNLLYQQSLLTSNVLKELENFYVQAPSHNTQQIFDLIKETKSNNSKHLKELNKTFITPVDKEAISRVFGNLYWINLSIKHLVVELDTFEIYNLAEYKKMFIILNQEISELTEGINMLSAKNYNAVIEKVEQIIHLDNNLIKQYANNLVLLFNKKDENRVYMHTEILMQLKQISKHIHICANLLEDIVFKIN